METYSGNKIWLVYVILWKNIFSRILWKMGPGNYFQDFFNFQIILCKKESKEVSVLIW